MRQSKQGSNSWVNSQLENNGYPEQKAPKRITGRRKREMLVKSSVVSKFSLLVYYRIMKGKFKSIAKANSGCS